jgi:hypothetical protein
MNQPYNPLEKRNLAESVVKRLLEQPLVSLKDIQSFQGAGVYAIYYRGDFAAYKVAAGSLSGQPDIQIPIYVGKADPEGGRKGGFGLDSAMGTKLYGRLRKHRSSVIAATNLDEDDFFYRALVVDEIWIPLAESLLISNFRPLWNVMVDGFGINAPGRGRNQQKKSSWDVLHPGRLFASNLPDGAQTAEEIIESLQLGISVGSEIEA